MYGTGTGRSKKEAEQQAAESAWRAIRAAADERAKSAEAAEEAAQAAEQAAQAAEGDHRRPLGSDERLGHGLIPS